MKTNKKTVTKQQIKEIKDAGFKIRTEQFRYLYAPNYLFKESTPEERIEELMIAGVSSIKEDYKYDPGNQEIYPKGGSVCVNILDKNNVLIIQKKSFCHLADNFNKKKGFAKALGRAYSYLKKAGMLDKKQTEKREPNLNKDYSKEIKEISKKLSMFLGHDQNFIMQYLLNSLDKVTKGSQNKI